MQNPMRFLISAAVAATVLATATFAHEYKIGGLHIDHPRSFETAKSVKVAGGYMTITNDTDKADRLIAVRADGIPRTELHLSETDANGVARMTRQENGIDVPAQGSVTLAPGGLHVMFMGLDGDPLKAGDVINATLVFETAGEIDVKFNVEARTDADHSGMDHSGHTMSD